MKKDKPALDPEKPLPAVERERAAELVASYSGFAETMLGFDLYQKQRECLDALEPAGSVVSFASCNGGGKTRIVILSAILQHLAMRGGKVIVTSGSFRQIKDQLIPALHGRQRLFPAFRFLETRVATSDPNSFMDAFSTNESGKFEGHHGDEAHQLLLIVDEAKTVKDPIFQAVERCRVPHKWCRVLFASSPGFAQGEFYRSQVSPQHLTHAPIRQKASDCPHISAEEIAQVRAKWGDNHPLVKSMLDCEFMPFVEGAIVQLDALDDCLANPPIFRPGQRKAFCDFAWSKTGSGDENVLALRDGNRITLEKCFRAQGMHAVCGVFVREFTRLGLRPWEIEGDADGDGANIIKQLRSMGWAIGSAHNGGKPRFDEHYGNLASEMWCEGARGIINREWILPDDGEMYGQMLNRRIVPNNRGLLTIESKQSMKDPNREGGSVPSSPDRADAVFGAMAPLPMANARQVMGQANERELPDTRESVWDDPRREEGAREYEHYVPGAFFG